MSAFPFFIDISDKTGLIVGGGAVACRKAMTLLQFGAQLRVVAPEVLPELKAMDGVTAVERPFCMEDLEPAPAFVVAATDNAAVNAQVAEVCRERGILVNVADDETACGFVFPSVIQRGDLTIAISTNGASPTAARFWRSKIDALLPEKTAQLLQYLRESRERLKASYPKGKHRTELIRTTAEAALKKGAPLTEAEEAAIAGDSLDKQQ